MVKRSEDIMTGVAKKIGDFCIYNVVQHQYYITMDTG